jgi:acetolactate synthase-1/2/3 large subunit
LVNERIRCQLEHRDLERDIEIAARAFLAAKNPIIYAGEGVLYAGATGELLEFADLAQAPVMTTLKAKGAIPEGHPLSIGGGGATGHDLWHHFIDKGSLQGQLGFNGLARPFLDCLF